MQIIIHKIKNKTLFKALFWGIMNMVLALPVLVSANGAGKTDCGAKLCNPLGVDTFAALIAAIANIIMKVGIPIAAIFLIYSGLMFVTARGSEEQLKKAKNTFMWTVVGAGILLGAVVIATGIEATIKALK
ncbi:MAG: TrbC/VirB2 family protein [Candidatus Paceibacterota bacterium]